MLDFLTSFSPAFILIAAGVLAGFIPASNISSHARKALLIGAPALALVLINTIYFSQTQSTYLGGHMSFAGIELTTLRIDNLSIIWGYIFCFAGILNGIFALHEKCKITDTSALIYTGAGIGAVFAGDLITLFIFWELLALSSVFIVWRGGPKSYPAGMRYLAMHILSGVLLLAGLVIYGRETGSYAFNNIGLDAPGGWLMLLAFGIKAGFPLLHNWIQDAYPRSSVTGTVILSVFTTKLAIYALARGFAGTEMLIYIGGIMAVFPVFFAVLENDLRKVLAYSLNNQLGFMVAGVGVGSTLALNGVAAHVVIDILFKGLLFMSMGAVLHRVGTTKASELGGLFRSMPYTAVFCMIGAAAISAVPFFGGFVSKSMIIAAVFEDGQFIVFAMLLFASAGVLEHSGIKVPYFAFFAHDSGKRVQEAPWNMLVAMGIAAFFCIYLAIPGPFGGMQHLYNLLPNEVAGAAKFIPYSTDHVVFQMQLIMAAMFAFALLKRVGLYPPERRAQILDFDWTYRRLGLALVKWVGAIWTRLGAFAIYLLKKFFSMIGRRMYQVFSPAGTFSQDAPSGIAAVLISGMLAAVLLVVYFF
ncbi:MAG: Na(+)/H(+) antiporter subunit D [Robiginitomaculum sp.]|nr:MAG: Na(+)/H(+) antiporter subunit D [Robiginitomaculum sp.]